MEDVTSTPSQKIEHGRCHFYPKPENSTWKMSLLPLARKLNMEDVTSTPSQKIEHGRCHFYPKPENSTWKMSLLPQAIVFK